MNTEDIRISKIDHKKTLAEFHLYKVSKTVKFIETECRMMVNGLGEGEKGICCLTHTELQICKRKKFKKSV